jgi:starvation-inducible DNA-binding protein
MSRTTTDQASNRTSTRAAAHANGRESMHQTRHDLPPKVRTDVANLLNKRLADCIDLQTQCKQAHWNVKGPSFIGLHKLFDDVYADVTTYVDQIAERIVQLGGTADGTARQVAERTTLDAYPTDITDQSKHVEALSDALAQFCRTTREAIDETDDRGDAGTADMLTDISRGLDKWLWFVEAHQHGSGARGR